MNGDDADGRRLTAHHEAGHAVAVAKCSGGRVDEIDITYNPDHRGRTLHDHRPEDQAFIIYAGPWAHALVLWKYEAFDEETRDSNDKNFADHVRAQFGGNLDDYRAYELEMSGANSVVDTYEVELLNAHFEGKDCCAVPPPIITPPDPAWHEKMVEAQCEIDALANALLAGDEIIWLSNGQRLVRQGPDVWRNPDVPSEVEYKNPG